MAKRKDKNISFNEVKKIYFQNNNDFIYGQKRSLGTMFSGGLAISILGFIYLGIWHIIRNYFFPTHQETLILSLVIIGLLAYTTDNLFVTQQKQGQKYIKEFNKKTGWWRIKWSIITALSPFLAIWFALSTSSYGPIGHFLLSLNGYSDKEISRRILNNSDRINKNKQSEQDILNQIRQHSSSNNERY